MVLTTSLVIDDANMTYKHGEEIQDIRASSMQITLRCYGSLKFGFCNQKHEVHKYRNLEFLCFRTKFILSCLELCLKFNNHFAASETFPFKLQDYREDPQDYNHGIPPLKRSKPNIPVDVLLEATKPIQPFPWDSETDLKVDG